MRNNKAQLSTTKKIIILLLVVALMIGGFGKLYAQARYTVKNDFDPEQFYAPADGEDALASSLRDKLTKQQVQGVTDIQMNLFASTKPYTDLNTYADGQLVLITSISDANQFFDTNGKEVGLKFQTAPRGLVSYLTQDKGSLETKSLLSDYKKAGYLKFRKLCYLPEEVHAPLIYELSAIPVEQPYPNGVFTSNLAEKYELNSFSLTQLSGGSTTSTTLDFEAFYTDTTLTNGAPIQHNLYVPSNTNHNEGLLVWVYGNSVCIMIREQLGGFGGGLQFDNKTGEIKGKNKFISDSLLTELKNRNLVEIV